MNRNKILIYFTGFVLFGLQLTCIQITNASNEIKDSGQEKIFQAGASTSNITPSLGDGIIGGWGLPPATHIHDELNVRCLVLDDGETKLAFIIVDILALNRNLIDEAKRLIHQETKLPVENILIAATHTHSATTALGTGEKRRDWSLEKSFDKYQELIISRIADGVRVALNNLEPARIGWGTGSVPQHVFVRRWKMKPGTPIPNPFGGQDKVRMNPGHNPNLLEPAGEPDPEVSFISVKSKDGRPIALFANYSLHYVGGVPTGHISADYFGVFADRIQELLKADRQDPPFVGILSNGTSGDVNNNNYAIQASGTYQPFEKIEIVADGVAREVWRVYNKIHHHDWVSLRSAWEELTLQVRKPDSQMIKRAQWVLSRPDTITPVHPREDVYAERILQLLEWPDQIDIVIQSFRIGELGVAAIPFETFSEIGLELKEKSPFRHTFTISLANGYYRYLPTPEQHELGGYETWLGTSLSEFESSRKIVSKLLESFETLK